MKCLGYSTEAKCPSFILFYSTQTFSTQTFSSDSKYFIWINVLLRSKWFSELFTRQDDSTNLWCWDQEQASVCRRQDISVHVCLTRRVPPNHSFPAKPFHTRDGKVLCQNTALDWGPEAILTKIQIISGYGDRSQGSSCPRLDRMEFCFFFTEISQQYDGLWWSNVANCCNTLNNRCEIW